MRLLFLTFGFVAIQIVGTLAWVAIHSVLFGFSVLMIFGVRPPPFVFIVLLSTWLLGEIGVLIFIARVARAKLSDHPVVLRIALLAGVAMVSAEGLWQWVYLPLRGGSPWWERL